MKHINSNMKVDAASYMVHVKRDFINYDDPMADWLNDHSIAYSVPNRADGAIGFWITSSQISGRKFGICASPNFKGPDTFYNANGNGEIQPAAAGISLPAALMTPNDIIVGENVPSYNINGYNANREIRYD